VRPAAADNAQLSADVCSAVKASVKTSVDDDRSAFAIRRTCLVAGSFDQKRQRWAVTG